MCVCITYMYIKRKMCMLYKLATIVEGNPKAPFQ